MTENAHPELIIVKRPMEDEHESHSSAWKVAHADFMTAMMAFFLIMWLINVTDDEVRKGISAYFNPIKLSDGVTDLKGLSKPTSGEEKRKHTKPGRVAESPDAFNPVKLSEARGAGAAASGDKGKAAAAAAAGGAGSGHTAPEAGLGAEKSLHDEHAAGGGETASIADTQGAGAFGEDEAAKAAGTTDAHGTPTGKKGNSDNELEAVAFQDPYAVLARIAEDYAEGGASTVDVIVGDMRQPGVTGGEIDRDPFDPAYWQTAPAYPAVTETPGEPGTFDPLPEAVQLDAAAIDNFESVGGEAAEPPAADAVPEEPATPIELAESAEQPSAGAAQHVAAAESPTDAPEAGEPPPEVEIAEAAPETTEPVVDTRIQAIGDQLKAEIATAVRNVEAIGAETGLIEGETVEVSVTEDGVLVNMADDATYSMFDIGSAVPDGRVVVLMEEIAATLADKPGSIVIRGHTDGRPFRSADYDNWRLSAARAQMAYYMLVRGGLDESRVTAIEGHADRALLNPDEPFAAENRRIEILLKVVE